MHVATLTNANFHQQQWSTTTSQWLSTERAENGFSQQANCNRSAKFRFSSNKTNLHTLLVLQNRVCSSRSPRPQSTCMGAASFAALHASLGSWEGTQCSTHSPTGCTLHSRQWTNEPELEESNTWWISWHVSWSCGKIDRKLGHVSVFLHRVRFPRVTCSWAGLRRTPEMAENVPISGESAVTSQTLVSFRVLVGQKTFLNWYILPVLDGRTSIGRWRAWGRHPRKELEGPSVALLTTLGSCRGFMFHGKLPDCRSTCRPTCLSRRHVVILDGSWRSSSSNLAAKKLKEKRVWTPKCVRWTDEVGCRSD